MSWVISERWKFLRNLGGSYVADELAVSSTLHLAGIDFHHVKFHFCVMMLARSGDVLHPDPQEDASVLHKS